MYLTARDVFALRYFSFPYFPYMMGYREILIAAIVVGLIGFF